jgi:hypothetical protein
MKLGIFPWFERKNTFKDNSVVEGRLAMPSNLGPRATLGGIPAPTSWQLPHIVVATRRPGDVSFSRDWPNIEPCPISVATPTPNVNKRADEVNCDIKVVTASCFNLPRTGSLRRAPRRIVASIALTPRDCEPVWVATKVFPRQLQTSSVAALVVITREHATTPLFPLASYYPDRPSDDFLSG